MIEALKLKRVQKLVDRLSKQAISDSEGLVQPLENLIDLSKEPSSVEFLQDSVNESVRFQYGVYLHDGRHRDIEQNLHDALSVFNELTRGQNTHIASQAKIRKSLVLHDQGLFHDALACAEEAVSQDPASGSANMAVSKILFAIGGDENLERARVICQEWAAKGEVRAFNNLAVFYLRAGKRFDFDQAERLLQLAADRELSISTRNLVSLYLGLAGDDNVEKASAILREEYRTDKTGWAGYALGRLVLAYPQEDGSQDQDALSMFERAADRGFRPAKKQVALMTARRIGKPDDAIKKIEEEIEKGFLRDRLTLVELLIKGKVEENLERAKEVLKPMVEPEQDPAAHYWMAHCCFDLAKNFDDPEAAYHLNLAVERGHTGAMVTMGKSKLERAESEGDRDYLEGMRLLRHAANLNNPEALHELGSYYFHVVGGQEGIRKATQLLVVGQRYGHSGCRTDLAAIYIRSGKRRLIDVARKTLRIAVLQNNLTAMGNYAALLLKDDREENTSHALELLERAISQKDAHSMFVLGNYFVQKQDPKNALRAVELLEEAGSLGIYTAARPLANAYLLIGDEKNRAHGRSILEKLAEADDAEAYNDLGLLDLKQNTKTAAQEALIKFDKGKELGSKFAAHNMKQARKILLSFDNKYDNVVPLEVPAETVGGDSYLPANKDAEEGTDAVAEVSEDFQEASLARRIVLRLAEERNSRGVKAKFIAAKMGVSPQYLSNLEKGRTGEPTFETIEKYAGALGVELDARIIGIE